MNLGELEKLVLHYLWKHKNVDVKNVYVYQFGGLNEHPFSTFGRNIDALV